MYCVLKYFSQDVNKGGMRKTSNEEEIEAIFAESNDGGENESSFFTNVGPFPSVTTQKEETKVIAQKMRLLLTKGVAGLQKVFPSENKNHQVGSG